MRPVPSVDALFGQLAAPGRWMAELASPLGVLRAPRAIARERELARNASEELEENLELLADLRRFAEPSEARLREGRRLVAAEVIGREEGHRDRLVVRLNDARGVEEGLPVALGNDYVGRVVEVHPEDTDGRSEAIVELVTARGFHVGAQVQPGPGEEPIYLSVGGIDVEPNERGAQGTDRQIRLAVHNPSDRELVAGMARVFELFPDAQSNADLAQGLRLGEIRAEEAGERWSVLPELDYLDGLFQVVILCPPMDLPARRPVPPILMDQAWLKTSLLVGGDPSPWRETAKIRAGSSHGIRRGAAVTALGARLVGRVLRTSPWSSDVSFLGDRGFHVAALARIEGEEQPQVLGRLVSLGREDDGSLSFRWTPRVDLVLSDRAGEGRRRARFFTGSGDAGLASGFFLGEGWMPVEARRDEPQILVIESELDPRDLRTLFVRTSGVSVSR